LGTATVLWVVALQLISGAIEPPREIDLSESEFTATPAPDLEPLPINLALVANGGIGIPAPSLESFFTRTGKSPASTFTALPVAAFLPVETTITTIAPTASTTIAPPATTTTARPVTTSAPPATTTPPPATTAASQTTAPPTTAPPTTAPPPSTTAATPTTAAPAGHFDAGAETDFASRINGLRSSVGRPALAGNAELNNYARWWAKYMADNNRFAHSDIGTLLNPWTIVGENIGAGGNVGGIFNALVNSPGHYNNMVEPRFTAVGVGVYIDASGKLWTAHVFAG
jgi:uncharacterized protein YkwD